jgi:hypothetical protein
VSNTAIRRSIAATGIIRLTSVFTPVQGSHDREPRENEEGTEMKNLGLATIAAAGLMAAVLGFAGPANADIGHHDWVNNIQPTVVVPHVDNGVHQSH